MNRIITDPGEFDPVTLIGIVENDHDSFTAGRRNNDIVNWFIACRLAQIAMGGDFHGAYPMSEDFKRRFIELQRFTMTDEQRVAINRWDENAGEKISRLCYRYYHRSTDQLRRLWLPMDYETNQVHKDQMELPTSS